MTLVRLSAVIALTAVGVSLGNRATAADVYYVPQSGSSPYDWSVVGNWFKDSAGTTALGTLPGTNESVVFPDSMAGQTLTLTEPASVYAVSGLKTGQTIEIGDGGFLATGHSATINNGAFLTVKSGGHMEAQSIFRLGSGGDNISKAKILVEEGGTFTNKNNYFALGFGKSGTAFFENHGYASFGNTTYVGYRVSSSSTAVGIIDNYGLFTTFDKGSTQLRLGAYAGTAGYLTNNVGGTVSLEMAMVVGASSNTTGTVVNKGTFDISARAVYLGGDQIACTNSTSSKYAKGYFYNLKDATATFGGEVRFSGFKYGSGTMDNRGDITFNNSCRIGYASSGTGLLSNHSTGVMNFNKGIIVGHSGTGTLESDGKITVSSASPCVVSDANGGKGTLRLYYGGTFKGNKCGLKIASANGSTGTVKMEGTSRMTQPGDIVMATGEKGSGTFEMGDNSVLDAPGEIAIGVGRNTDTTQAWTGLAKFVLSGNAVITNMNNHIHVVSNFFGKGILELRDNARIVYSNARARHLRIGYSHNVSPNSRAELRLRGGEIVFATNSTVVVGKNSSSVTNCNGFISGWGRLTRHDLSKGGSDFGLNLTLFCGAVTADGDGELHDLDLSHVRKINDNGQNLSGTNGWYAINKGRLTYPCRNTSYRMLGDYYSRTGDPVYVNGVAIDCEGISGDLIGQLYATDRDDIPAGLPGDDLAAKTLRLGVWRATVNKNYNLDEVSKANAGSFSSATARIRYDNFRLAALKDADGAFSSEQRVALYRHDGTASGRWIKVASLDATEAEANGHLIGGALPKVDADWNLGFFAVVAEPKKGTSIIIR